MNINHSYFWDEGLEQSTNFIFPFYTFCTIWIFLISCMYYFKKILIWIIGNWDLGLYFFFAYFKNVNKQYFKKWSQKACNLNAAFCLSNEVPYMELFGEEYQGLGKC